MKQSYYLLIIPCVSVICFQSTLGSHSSLFRKPKTVSQESHGIHKRQDDSGSDQNELCSRLLIATACTNNEIQGLADFYQQCNYSTSAQGLKDVCAYNSEGKYCGELNTDEVLSTCDLFASNCSSECRSALIKSRHQLGCCANVTYSLLGSLWSRCGVDIEAKTCASTVTVNPAKTDSTCSQKELLAGTVSIFCKRRYVEDLQDKLSGKDECQDFKIDSLYTSCKVDKNGTYCVTLSDKVQTLYLEASYSCMDNSTCEPRCVEALNNITNTVGCCINEEYNDTNDALVDWWLSNHYWHMCKLESPGLCEVKLTGNKGLTPGGIAGITIALAAVLVASVVAIVVTVVCVMRVITKRRLAQYVSVQDEELLETAGAQNTSTSHTEHEKEVESEKNSHSDLTEDN